MNGTVVEKLPDDVIERANSVDLTELVGKFVELHKIGPREFAGRCPKCGGEDRFHVWPEDGNWHCLGRDNGRNGCGKHGDAIAFVMFVEGVSFREAVEQLTNGAVRTVTIKREHRDAGAKAEKQTDDWQKKASAIVAESQRRLWDDVGAVGREYLESRGLDSGTWMAYGLGYDPAVHVQGTDGKVKAPAIVMPWFSQSGGLVAIRYRYLVPQDGARLKSEPGSKLRGRMYGGQVLPPVDFDADGSSIEKKFTLLLIEGEINAMSCWQVAHDTRLDVLSTGGQGQALTISDKLIDFAKRYGKVLVWFDEPSVSKGVVDRIPGSYGVRSPLRKDAASNIVFGEDGKPKKIDANDMLRDGTLGGFLAMMRAEAADNIADIENLLWNLYDAALLPAGLDDSTASVVKELSRRLGRQSRLVKVEENRWVAR